MTDCVQARPRLTVLPGGAQPGAAPDEPFVVVIVGAGPRGTGVLERLLANLAEDPVPGPVRIDVVDPHPPGGGRVWRAEQSPLMWMNAVAEKVTMFPDESVRDCGPLRPGPTLSEWAATEGGAPELGGLDFARRQLQSRYLSWVFDRVVAGRPAGVTVEVHAGRAVGLTDAADDRQQVWLDGRDEPLVADAVVLTLGHPDVRPAGGELVAAGFAARHGLRHLPRGYAADIDLAAIRPGEQVVVRGLGAAFVDLMILLTEGRGGEFHQAAGGELAYLPSGREPVLAVGSRRGVPYRAKATYRAPAGGAEAAPPLPRFFDAAEIDRAYSGRLRLDFFTDLWPAMAKEIGWGYYWQLFAAHPDRVRLDPAEFAARYAELDWDSPGMRDLVAAAVPAAEDRLDLAAVDRPLAGLAFADRQQLHEHVCEHVAADVRRRSDPAYSADLGAFAALLSVNGQLGRLRCARRLTARSRVRDLHGWWQSFFEYFGSGAPAHRTRQLLALARAGVLRFVGPDMWVEADEATGTFRAGSPAVPGAVEATGLIEAQLPVADVRASADPLLRSLYERGELGTQVLADDDGFRHESGLAEVRAGDYRLVDAAGCAHPRRFAIGPFTTERSFGTFARPRSDAPAFRQNNAIARALLQLREATRATGTAPAATGTAPEAAAPAA